MERSSGRNGMLGLDEADLEAARSLAQVARNRDWVDPGAKAKRRRPPLSKLPNDPSLPTSPPDLATSTRSHPSGSAPNSQPSSALPSPHPTQDLGSYFPQLGLEEADALNQDTFSSAAYASLSNLPLAPHLTMKRRAPEDSGERPPTAKRQNSLEHLRARPPPINTNPSDLHGSGLSPAPLLPLDPLPDPLQDLPPSLTTSQWSQLLQRHYAQQQLLQQGANTSPSGWWPTMLQSDAASPTMLPFPQDPLLASPQPLMVNNGYSIAFLPLNQWNHHLPETPTLPPLSRDLPLNPTADRSHRTEPPSSKSSRPSQPLAGSEAAAVVERELQQLAAKAGWNLQPNDQSPQASDDDQEPDPHPSSHGGRFPHPSPRSSQPQPPTSQQIWLQDLGRPIREGEFEPLNLAAVAQRYSRQGRELWALQQKHGRQGFVPLEALAEAKARSERVSLNSGNSQSQDSPTAPSTFAGKTCASCRQHLPFKCYYKRSNMKDGLSASCKSCMPKYDVSVTEKVCSSCRRMLPSNNFVRKHDVKDGLSSRCKDCLPRYNVSVDRKECISCGLMQSSSNFYKEQRSRDGLASKCKICTKNRPPDELPPALPATAATGTPSKPNLSVPTFGTCQRCKQQNNLQRLPNNPALLCPPCMKLSLAAKAAHPSSPGPTADPGSAARPSNSGDLPVPLSSGGGGTSMAMSDDTNRNDMMTGATSTGASEQSGDDPEAPSGETKQCVQCRKDVAIEQFPKCRKAHMGRSDICMVCKPRYEVSVSHKFCSVCGVDRPAKMFVRKNDSRDGLSTRCKACLPRYQVVVEYKMCASCRQLQPAANFRRESKMKDGLHSRCKTCQVAQQLECQVAAGAKICTGCQQRLPLTQFVRKNDSRDGLSSRCKGCLPKFQVSVTQKECNNCLQTLPAACFYREPKRKDGLSPCCRECKRLAHLPLRNMSQQLRSANPGRAGRSRSVSTASALPPVPTAPAPAPAAMQDLGGGFAPPSVMQGLQDLGSAPEPPVSPTEAPSAAKPATQPPASANGAPSAAPVAGSSDGSQQPMLELVAAVLRQQQMSTGGDTQQSPLASISDPSTLIRTIEQAIQSVLQQQQQQQQAPPLPQQAPPQASVAQQQSPRAPAGQQPGIPTLPADADAAVARLAAATQSAADAAALPIPTTAPETSKQPVQLERAATASVPPEAQQPELAAAGAAASSKDPSSTGAAAPEAFPPHAASAAAATHPPPPLPAPASNAAEAAATPLPTPPPPAQAPSTTLPSEPLVPAAEAAPSPVVDSAKSAADTSDVTAALPGQEPLEPLPAAMDADSPLGNVFGSTAPLEAVLTANQGSTPPLPTFPQFEF